MKIYKENIRKKSTTDQDQGASIRKKNIPDLVHKEKKIKRNIKRKVIVDTKIAFQNNI